MLKPFLALVIALQFFVACGNNESESPASSSANSAVKTGVFSITKPVANLHYSTRGFSDNYTNDKGEFKYYEGEVIKFDVFGVSLGEATAQANLNPFNLVPGADSVEDSSAYGAVALIMSLDAGAGTGEIFTIDNAIKAYNYGKDFDLNSVSSLSLTDVYTILSNINSANDTSFSLDSSTLTDAYDYISNLISGSDTPAQSSSSSESSLLDDATDYLFGSSSSVSSQQASSSSESSLLDGIF